MIVVPSLVLVICFTFRAKNIAILELRVVDGFPPNKPKLLFCKSMILYTVWKIYSEILETFWNLEIVRFLGCKFSTLINFQLMLESLINFQLMLEYLKPLDRSISNVSKCHKYLDNVLLGSVVSISIFNHEMLTYNWYIYLSI